MPWGFTKNIYLNIYEEMFTFFSSNNILTLKIMTSFKTTSSFLYRIWNVLLQIRESWTEAGKAKVIPKTDKICNWQVKGKIQLYFYFTIHLIILLQCHDFI